MNVFNEFIELSKLCEDAGIKYALVGGVAMAFHDEPRFTQDIDILIDEKYLATLKATLLERGYFESTKPWTFQNSKLTFHRYLKTSDDNEILIDVLVAGDEMHKKIIENALDAKTEQSIIRVAQKEDLIKMKKVRNSKQDQADIERLENDQN